MGLNIPDYAKTPEELELSEQVAKLKEENESIRESFIKMVDMNRELEKKLDRYKKAMEWEQDQLKNHKTCDWIYAGTLASEPFILCTDNGTVSGTSRLEAIEKAMENKT